MSGLGVGSLGSDAPDAVGDENFVVPATTDVTQFQEVREAWNCPHLSAGLGGPGEELFHEGTVLRLDGSEHLKRRRTLGALLKRRGHQRFRDAALYPTARSALDHVLESAGSDGYARVDLMRWALRVNFQLAAAIVGFDDAETPEGADQLFELMEAAFRARPGAEQVAMGRFDKNTEAVRRGLEARAELIERFYVGALARRRDLVERVRAGEMDEAELPQDMLTLIATDANPDYRDGAVAEREAMFVFVAGTHTTSSSMIWTLRELHEWFAHHPEDAERSSEPAFLLAAANEALRLHPVVPGFPRRALEDVELCQGTRIEEGSIAMILQGPPNVDPEIWGADAATFNPWRTPPKGMLPHGFAFGAGPHMCYGTPLVMGQEGLDGSLVHLLQLVLEAGVMPDPEVAPAPSVVGTSGHYVAQLSQYPVVFPVGGASG